MKCYLLQIKVNDISVDIELLNTIGKVPFVYGDFIPTTKLCFCTVILYNICQLNIFNILTEINLKQILHYY